MSGSGWYTEEVNDNVDSRGKSLYKAEPILYAADMEYGIEIGF
jgi:hypothetical protein